MVEPFVLHDTSLKTRVLRIHFEKSIFISYGSLSIQFFKNYYKKYINLFDEF